MMNPVVFMGPSAGVSVLALIFCMVASISWCGTYSCVKNTHFLKYLREPKASGNKLEYFLGLSHHAYEETSGKEREIVCSSIDNDPRCSWAKDDDGCETKEVADSCKDDCDEYCKAKFAGSNANLRRLGDGTEDECKKKCLRNVQNQRAQKYAFAAAILSTLILLVVIILSGLRIGAMNTLPIKIVAIVLSFLAFIFLMAGFSVLIAHPKKNMEKDVEEDSSCDTTNDCEVSMGPTLILMIVAWLFTFVPLICHAVCPTGILGKEGPTMSQP